MRDNTEHNINNNNNNNNNNNKKVTVSNTSGAEVSSLLNKDQMLLEEEEWDKLFTNFDGFSIVETEETETEHNSKNTCMRWAKEVDKISCDVSTKVIQQKQDIEIVKILFEI